jgi:hypothetical protein
MWLAPGEFRYLSICNCLIGITETHHSRKSQVEGSAMWIKLWKTPCPDIKAYQVGSTSWCSRQGTATCLPAHHADSCTQLWRIGLEVHYSYFLYPSQAVKSCGNPSQTRKIETLWGRHCWSQETLLPGMKAEHNTSKCILPDKICMLSSSHQFAHLYFPVVCLFEQNAHVMVQGWMVGMSRNDALSQLTLAQYSAARAWTRKKAMISFIGGLQIRRFFDCSFSQSSRAPLRPSKFTQRTNQPPIPSTKPHPSPSPSTWQIEIEGRLGSIACGKDGVGEYSKGKGLNWGSYAPQLQQMQP